MSAVNAAIAAWNTLVLILNFAVRVSGPAVPPEPVRTPACVDCAPEASLPLDLMADGPENMRDGARGTVATPDPQFDANMADWQP